MALHGSIKVNNHELICWAAVRKDEVPESPRTFNYECIIESVEDPSSKMTFFVQHSFDDGADRLLVALLNEAHHRGFRKEPPMLRRRMGIK